MDQLRINCYNLLGISKKLAKEELL